jgi:enoyl-CoA hydratase/carnithine racemase
MSSMPPEKLPEAPPSLPPEVILDGAPFSSLDMLRMSQAGSVIQMRLARPQKRNALNDALIAQVQTALINLPQSARVLVLSGAGEHFCAGLDMTELSERSVAAGVMHSRTWHAAFEQVQFGRVPVIAVLQGAVIGGGLELAAAAHIRVADRSAFYALPEGSRGLFVGGGGSVRISSLIGVGAMTDLMLTGRVLDAEDGHRLGLSQYLVAPGAALDHALELAQRIAGNAPLSNFAIVQALPRIASLSPTDGLFFESLMAGIASGDEAAKQRLRAYLEGKAGKVRP